MTVPTPNLDKIKENAPVSQEIGAFLDWLTGEAGYTLAKYGDHERLWPQNPGFEQLLADYFGVDLQEVERERQAVLKEYHRQVAESREAQS